MVTNRIYIVKGFENLNKEFDILDSDENVLDYTFETVNRDFENSKVFEYEFQVIYK